MFGVFLKQAKMAGKNTLVYLSVQKVTPDHKFIAGFPIGRLKQQMPPNYS